MYKVDRMFWTNKTVDVDVPCVGCKHVKSCGHPPLALAAELSE